MVNKVILLVAVSIIGLMLFIYRDEWPDLQKPPGRNLLPSPDFRADIFRGEKNYQESCARCHGTNLVGTDKGPSLLDDVYKPSHHADLSFFYAVKNGVRQHHWKFGDMPIITGVSPERTSDIVAYVRHMQRKQ